MMSSVLNMLSLGYSELELQVVCLERDTQWWEKPRTDGKSLGVAKDGSHSCWPQHTDQLFLSFLSPVPPSCQAQGIHWQQ